MLCHYATLNINNDRLSAATLFFNTLLIHQALTRRPNALKLSVLFLQDQHRQIPAMFCRISSLECNHIKYVLSSKQDG